MDESGLFSGAAASHDPGHDIHSAHRTGGNRGIGRSAALHLARDGVDVLLTYRSHAEEAAAVVEVEAEPSIVGSFVTAFGAVAAVAYQRDRENKRETALMHREQLAPIYEDLFAYFKHGGMIPTAGRENFIEDFQRKLILYGSDRVVAAWVGWIRTWPVEEQDDTGEGDALDVPDDELPDPTSLLGLENLLFALRRDLGHENKELKPGDLLRIWVNDIDAHLTTPEESHAAVTRG